MSPDLITPPANTHAEIASTLLTAAFDLFDTIDIQNLDEARASAHAATLAAMAQAHATLAAAEETRAAAYDTRTAAYVNYFATLASGNHADKQHAAVIDKLIQDRLKFAPTEGETTP